jgi:hypothetical protein
MLELGSRPAMLSTVIATLLAFSVSLKKGPGLQLWFSFSAWNWFLAWLVFQWKYVSFLVVDFLCPGHSILTPLPSLNSFRSDFGFRPPSPRIHAYAFVLVQSPICFSSQVTHVIMTWSVMHYDCFGVSSHWQEMAVPYTFYNDGRKDDR